jgi:GDP-L-fucose synthase
MVGSAIVSRLERNGYSAVLPVGRDEVDLCCQAEVNAWFAQHQPEYVFNAAARVGGIYANATYPAEFLYQNLMLQCNVAQGAHEAGTKKVMFLGSSCVYPRLASQPISESALLTGPLEVTNEAYAVAKIAGLKLAETYAQQYGDNFIAAMPTNLYGYGDNFNLENSHVIPALLRRFHEAKACGAEAVVCWGTGKVYREFMFVDDLADALVFLMQEYNDPALINVGGGADVNVQELAQIIGSVVGFEGRIEWDSAKPDGTPRKLLDVSKLQALGWTHSTSLRDGLAKTYDWFLENRDSARL